MEELGNRNRNNFYGRHWPPAHFVRHKQDILNERHLIKYYELYGKSSTDDSLKAFMSLLFIHDRYGVDSVMKALAA